MVHVLVSQHACHEPDFPTIKLTAASSIDLL